MTVQYNLSHNILLFVRNVSEKHTSSTKDKLFNSNDFEWIFFSYICSEQAGRPKCPIDPFYIVPDKCKCVDFQVLKLQEAPEAVPNGEMPRHMQLYCDRYVKTNDSFWHGQSLNCKCQLYNNGLVCFRYMCDKVVPGNRVTVVGIYSIKKTGKPTVSVYKNNSLD